MKDKSAESSEQNGQGWPSWLPSLSNCSSVQGMHARSEAKLKHKGIDGKEPVRERLRHQKAAAALFGSSAEKSVPLTGDLSAFGAKHHFFVKGVWP